MNRLLLAVLLLLSTCSQPDVFSEYRSFPNAGWNKEEIVRFEVPIRDASVPYRVMIQTRNDNRYPYRNIWLFIDCQTPDGSLRTDTLCADLADAYGKWYGSGISRYDYSFPYQLHVQYPDTGIYIYSLRQGMRDDVLVGITDVGVGVTDVPAGEIPTNDPYLKNNP